MIYEKVILISEIQIYITSKQSFITSSRKKAFIPLSGVLSSKLDTYCFKSHTIASKSLIGINFMYGRNTASTSIFHAVICRVIRLYNIISFLFTANATKPTYVYATADFVDKVTGEVQISDKRKTYLLPDGNFVFQWRVPPESKTWYVLTSNDGKYLSDGSDDDNTHNAKTPENWKETYSTPYTIDNFQGNFIQ